MRTLMISTCGTSLLTSGADSETRKVLSEAANLTSKTVPDALRERLSRRIADCRSSLANADLRDCRRLSAELNGIFRFYHDQPRRHAGDPQVLLHTDTWLGTETARLLEECLTSHGLPVELLSFPGLRTDTLVDFQDSVVALIGWCHDTLPGYRARGYRVVFNLTGGFKSIQGWMQTLGMIHADEIVYVFESADELLRIPRLPVALEAGTRQVLRRHLPFFRRLAAGCGSCPTADLPDLPEAFLTRLDDQASLSPWGKLVWEQGRTELYAERLLEPPTDRVRYADRFRKDAADLSPDRLVLLNQRIDDLAAHLAGGANPHRLDFKPLRGDPLPPSSHEFDAWADQAAWRGFGHFEGRILVLDRLGPGLH